MENIPLRVLVSKKTITKNFYEKEAWDQGSVLCGVDEVGRGCLAGPLVTAAAILHGPTNYRLLKDSKTMSRDDLIKAQKWIVKHSWFGYGIINNYLIDEHNIYQATLIAMKRAVMQALLVSPFKPLNIVVDAMPLNLSFSGYQDIPIHQFPRAESLSVSVAAASILAKVKRDDLISRYDRVIPGYAFAKHKGYATVAHRKAIQETGRSVIHRMSFLGKILATKGDKDEQSTLI